MAEYYTLEIDTAQENSEAERKRFIWQKANARAITFIQEKTSRGIKLPKNKIPYVIVEEDEKNKGRYYLIINYHTLETDNNITPRKAEYEFDPFQDTIKLVKDVNLLEELANNQR